MDLLAKELEFLLLSDYEWQQAEKVKQWLTKKPDVPIEYAIEVKPPYVEQAVMLLPTGTKTIYPKVHRMKFTFRISDRVQEMYAGDDALRTQIERIVNREVNKYSGACNCEAVEQKVDVHRSHSMINQRDEIIHWVKLVEHWKG